MGKTTLVRECVLPYEGKLGGFVTLEVREPDGRSSGFEVLSLDDQHRGIFASKNFAGPAKVGKYGLNMVVFEEIGNSALRRALNDPGIRLIVIDEIGAMEAQSPDFRKLARECLGQNKKPVLATVRAKNYPFVEELEELGVEMAPLTRERYLETKRRLKDWITVLGLG